MAHVMEVLGFTLILLGIGILCVLIRDHVVAIRKLLEKR
jgi:hypothetical protein